MKICSRCKQDKPLDQFHKDLSKRDHLHSQCKQCHSERQRNKRKNNPEWRELENIKSKQFRQNFPEKFRLGVRNATLKAKYGITAKEFNARFEAQNYSCFVCKRTESKGNGAFHVDHCHTTGKVRGILCQPCNVTLGKVEESPVILRALANYIESYKET
jgi:hypothetical protein